MKLKVFIRSCGFLWLVLCLSTSVQAQLLPDNKHLNAQSVHRWMQTNRDIAPVIQVIDSAHTTEVELKAFEELSEAEQDQLIDAVLKTNNMQESVHDLLRKYGWKSVGEYMRLSTRLGNAIAAYFLFGDVGQMTKEQAEQLKEKADPAVLAVPQSDITFIRQNEKVLQKYIQAYAAGR
jgi:hypothetical protein